jgi:hypothetical protein
MRSPLNNEPLEKLVKKAEGFAKQAAALGAEASTFAREKFPREQIKETIETLRLSKCGKIIGSDGLIYEPVIPVPQNLAFMHADTARSAAPILFINGINCEVSDAAHLAQQLADTTKSPVYALYNQTINLFHDVTQSLTDKLNITSKPAVETLCGIICDALRDSKPLHLVAHSHGAVVVSTALSHAISTLRAERHCGTDQLVNELGRITVETFGGAATIYPDGPRYIHYVDQRDPVCWYAGVGRFGLSKYEVEQNEARFVKSHVHRVVATISVATGEFIRPGAGAIIRRVESLDQTLLETDAHALQNYLRARIEPSQLADPGREYHTARPSTTGLTIATAKRKVSELTLRATSALRDLKERFGGE